MGRCIYARKGFTIIELLIATTIMLLIVVGALAIYIMSLTVWKEGGVQIALQRKASIAMEKMVRGADVDVPVKVKEGGVEKIIKRRVGLRGAYEVNKPDPTDNSKIEYKVRYWDGSLESGSWKYRWKGFNLDGDNSEIYYDPDTSTIDDEFSIAVNVAGLIFSVSGDIVTIDLVLEDQVRDRTLSVDLSTQVKLRN